MRFLFSISLVLLVLASFSQDLDKENKPRLEKELLFFSNDGCGKCAKAQTYFEQHRMPFQKLAIRENRPLMYEFIHQKTGGKSVGVSYPILVYGDSIYFNFKDAKKVLMEIEQMMYDDKLILKEE